MVDVFTTNCTQAFSSNNASLVSAAGIPQKDTIKMGNPTMPNPDDLSITLRATRYRQHVLNGGPEGATFPGWFLTVQQNEGYDVVVPPTQLSLDQVMEISATIDKVIDRTNQTNSAPSRTVNAAKRCNNAMRKELERQLEAAETAAAKIPELRRRLGKEI